MVLIAICVVLVLVLALMLIVAGLVGRIGAVDAAAHVEDKDCWYRCKYRHVLLLLQDCAHAPEELRMTLLVDNRAVTAAAPAENKIVH